MWSKLRLFMVVLPQSGSWKWLIYEVWRKGDGCVSGRAFSGSISNTCRVTFYTAHRKQGCRFHVSRISGKINQNPQKRQFARRLIVFIEFRLIYFLESLSEPSATELTRTKLLEKMEIRSETRHEQAVQGLNPVRWVSEHTLGAWCFVFFRV